MPERAQFRTVFISDAHLGASGARTADLARFLKRIDCRTLYLVGDVIDMWRLKQRWYWPEPNNRVVNRILKMARRGTPIVFIPGNHDEPARRYAALVFGGVEVALQATHITADGRAILVTHGDRFDLVVRHARLLSAVGSRMYDWLVRLNFHYNWTRHLCGLEYWSLSQYIKTRVKSACTHISRFEDALLDEAGRTGHDAVLCGTSTRPRRVPVPSLTTTAATGSSRVPRSSSTTMGVWN